jgi:hypothetical protein
LIVDRRPDVVVCLGDFADLGSLSSYDKGKKDFEGRRFQKDVDSVRDALARIQKPLKECNEQAKKNKKGLYKPRMVMLGGNHDESRINRVVNLHPELDGVLSLGALGYEEHGWEYVKYAKPICIDGVWYCHHFPSGVKGEPIGGVNIGASLLAKNMATSIVGHSHVFDVATRSRPDGKRMWGISTGCYFEESMKYAESSEFLWWRGLVCLNDVDDGNFDLETINIKEVRRRYS